VVILVGKIFVVFVWFLVGVCCGLSDVNGVFCVRWRFCMEIVIENDVLVCCGLWWRLVVVGICV
jgi:hypothetical protein